MSTTYKIPKTSLARDIKKLMDSTEGLPLEETTLAEFERLFKRALDRHQVKMNFTIHLKDTMIDVVPLDITSDLILDGISSQIFELKVR